MKLCLLKDLNTSGNELGLWTKLGPSSNEPVPSKNKRALLVMILRLVKIFSTSGNELLPSENVHLF